MIGPLSLSLSYDVGFSLDDLRDIEVMKLFKDGDLALEWRSDAWNIFIRYLTENGTGYKNCEVRTFIFTKGSTTEEAHIVEVGKDNRVVDVVTLGAPGIFPHMVLNDYHAEENQYTGSQKGIQNSIRNIAKRVVYRGKIDVTFHDTTSPTTIQSQAIKTEGDNTSIKISWIFE
ncbi:hypothetical protein NHQ30_006871 [Ciborinia camelliae]|nr:hypothetical protein NHQ30_006871 [Ciborinia camelliae]